MNTDLLFRKRESVKSTGIESKKQDGKYARKVKRISSSKKRSRIKGKKRDSGRKK